MDYGEGCSRWKFAVQLPDPGGRFEPFLTYVKILIKLQIDLTVVFGRSGLDVFENFDV